MSKQNEKAQKMSSPGGMRSSRGKIEDKTVKRLLKYMKPYKVLMIIVCVCIILSAIANVASSLFIQRLIDSYIKPLLIDANPVFTGLLQALMMMACIYLIGVLTTLFYNRTMAVVSQGILKKIRDQMFSHMQTLPIKYFDTHTNGDVMSYYTNDTDTLRQMISQSIPQMFSSFITIVAVFCGMMYISIWLTLFVVVFLFVILKVTRKIAGKSGSYFVKQQASLGDVNGYIEEMINGQKVVKVFCYEEVSKEEFDKKNDELCKNATEANTYANILMPLMNSFGYILYVLLAIIGGTMAITGIMNVSLFSVNVLTLGMIASFLQLSRNFYSSDFPNVTAA